MSDISVNILEKLTLSITRELETWLLDIVRLRLHRTIMKTIMKKNKSVHIKLFIVIMKTVWMEENI